MALNPNTIKALFGKLVPYADDVTKGVATYGDDVADDLTRLSTYVSKHNARSPEVPMPVKTALQSPVLNSYGFSNDPPTGVLAKLQSTLQNAPSNNYKAYKANRTFIDAVQGAEMRGNIVDTPRLTKHLGRVEPHGFEAIAGDDGRGWYEFAEDAITLPQPLPVDGLVANSSKVVPHRNTALGRWYADKRAEFDSLVDNAPDFDAMDAQNVFKNAEDYDDMRNYLDTRDAVRRVNLAIGDGSVSNVPDSDVFNYVDNLHNLSYYDDYDENDLSSLYDALKRRRNTNETFKTLFGKTPKALPTTPEYDSRIQTLEELLKKFK